jgi:cytochrome c biogenesis protein CcmG/thiol:disulfide interchange protein DsbE
MTAVQDNPPPVRRRMVSLLPLVIFLGLAALMFYRLGSGDPSHIPSALIGHPAPATDLPPVVGLARDGKPTPGLAAAEFAGQVTLVNVWGSWCEPCREEAKYLLRLGQDTRLRLVGIDYKDRPEQAREFLRRYGHPFVAVGADESGRAAIEWGVYGVPETFVVGRDAKIAFKLIGPITAENFGTVLKAEIEKAIAKAL